MVLKFTSQRHKKKLKLRGEGPYIAYKITKTGADYTHLTEPTSQVSSMGANSNVTTNPSPSKLYSRCRGENRP